MKSKPRKTSSRKPSKLDQIHRSQKRILAAFANQTREIGHLRNYILKLKHRMRGVLEVHYGNSWPHLPGYGPWVCGVAPDPLNPVDSPQPPLV